jgi:hypothetical protein
MLAVLLRPEELQLGVPLTVPVVAPDVINFTVMVVVVAVGNALVVKVPTPLVLTVIVAVLLVAVFPPLRS